MFIKNLAFGVRLITLFFLSSLAVLVIINIKRTENLDALRRTVDVENHESMYINIPKINLLMPLYLVDSSENNLDDGLMIYNYEPLVILGHSGTNLKNYFNNLKKLVVNDIFEIHYGDYQGWYQIIKRYKKQKKLPLALEGDIILVTCDLINTKEQYVFVAKKS